MNPMSARQSVLCLHCCRPRASPSNFDALAITFWTHKRQASQAKADSRGNPVLAQYLASKKKSDVKRKQEMKDLAEHQVRGGDLSSGSVFDEPSGSQSRDAAKGTGKIDRDPKNMAAALDPRPGVRKRWERKMLIQSVRRRGRLSAAQLLKQAEREALSKSAFFRTSVKKLTMLARQIAGKKLSDAMVQMRFSKKKVAADVLQHLKYARNTAIVERGMGLDGSKIHETPLQIVNKDGKRIKIRDPSEMYIDQAWVGRGKYKKSMEFRARGRTNMLRHPSTSITVLLKEEKTRIRQAQEREEKRQNRKTWVQLPNRPIPTQRQYYTW